MQIETEGLDELVYTDDKWLSFILGQLISNAARYSSAQPLMRINASPEDGRVALSVWDNGIGIPDHELIRIFDRGFTGSNGRRRGGSTGMGLHICRKLAGSLEIELSAQSVENEYTKIIISLPAKECLTKM